MPKRGRILSVAALAASLAMAISLVVWRFVPIGARPAVSIRPATMSAPATRLAATAPAPPPTYIDVIRAANPAVPATQPLGVPLDLSEAAHLIVHDPVYLDGSGMLWITQANASPVAAALAHPQDPPEHVVRDRVVFVHWWLDDDGEWRSAVVTAGTGGGFVFVTATDQTPLPVSRHYHWAAAYSWQNRIVVPADQGVSVFDCVPKLVEHYHALPGLAGNGNPAVTVLDSRGVLAWSPWENGRPGSAGASRFVDGSWSDLAGGLWSTRPIQLNPLLDGSVLQIGALDPAAANDPGALAEVPADAPPAVSAAAPGPPATDAVSLVIAPLDQATINTSHISDLVGLLNDADDQKRQSAFDELSRYGPSLAPVLEQLSQDQPPETRLRLRQLLRARVTPALDGVEIIDRRLSVVRRQDDGTVLLYAAAGVRVPRANSDDPEEVTPAWICVRPGGRLDPPLLHALVADQRPDACTLTALRDDWLVCDGAGVRRFMGNTLQPITAPAEAHFNRVIGQDRRGRWIIGDGNAGSTDTLIIDTTIADPAPRLPGWAMTIDNGATGWDAGDWPAIQRGGGWALKSDAWAPLDEHDSMVSVTPAVAPFAAATTRGASTQPASQPAALATPLLRTADGTYYFGGQTNLTMIDARGHRADWPLPAAAVGSIAPSLVRTGDGSLYLYNSPGRMLWLKPAGGGAGAYRLAATFTHGIPNADHLTRMWVDPLGRIDLVYDNNKLLILFPGGVIPPEIAKMMPG
jgi:hypothetical protein